MNLLIEWTETAQRDRERIYTYWNTRNNSISFFQKTGVYNSKGDSKSKTISKYWSRFRPDKRKVLYYSKKLQAFL